MALSDLLRPRLTELGKIKIGGLGELKHSKGGKAYRAPRKDDHFTITTLNRSRMEGGAQGDLVIDKPLMDELMTGYGDADGFLRKIPIYVLSDDPEDVMQSAWLSYNGKRLIARCDDNKRLVKFVDRKTGQVLPSPVESEWKPEYAKAVDDRGAPYFKKHTVFNCVIASQQARWGGVYKFRTTSVISGDQLYGGLIQILELTRGVLVGLQLQLSVRPMLVTPEGRAATTVYVVHLELLGKDLIAIQHQALKTIEANYQQSHQIAVIRKEYKRMIHAPGSEDQVEAGELEQEFHAPETQPAGPPLGNQSMKDEPQLESEGGDNDIHDAEVVPGDESPQAEEAATSKDDAPHVVEMTPDQAGERCNELKELIRLCGTLEDLASLKKEADDDRGHLGGFYNEVMSCHDAKLAALQQPKKPMRRKQEDPGF